MAMTTEHKTARAAARKLEKHLNSLKPIAHEVQVIRTWREGYTACHALRLNIDGIIIEGETSLFNRAIEKLGYRPVRVTRNMLNPVRAFCIDINTPVYLDPGCDSYHSM